MKIIDLLMAPRKAAEAKRLRERRQETRNAAFLSARELCAAAGPGEVAHTYECFGSMEEIALAFARRAYNPEAVTSAACGAIEGFKLYIERQRTPPNA